MAEVIFPGKYLLAQKYTKSAQNGPKMTLSRVFVNFCHSPLLKVTKMQDLTILVFLCQPPYHLSASQVLGKNAVIETDGGFFDHQYL